MDKALAIRNDMSLNDLGQTLVKSGFFSDTREASQAIVKVLAGRELGLGPIASMTGINVIQGRISLSANLIAAAIKRSGRYNYIVIDNTDEKCEIQFMELMGGEWKNLPKTSVFTAADARKAGTKNMEKFPRNMLFARAISNGARWYCPDVFSGPVYTPEEMGAEVNEDGEVIDVKPAEITPAPVVEVVTPKPSLAAYWPMDQKYPSWQLAQTIHDRAGDRYLDMDDAKLDETKTGIEAIDPTKLSEAKIADLKMKLSTIEAIRIARASQAQQPEIL